MPDADPVRRLLLEHLAFRYVDGNQARFVGPFTTLPRVFTHFVLVRFRGPWRIRIGTGPVIPCRSGACLVGSGVQHEFTAERGEAFDAHWVHGRFELFTSLELTAFSKLILVPEGSAAQRIGRSMTRLNSSMTSSTRAPGLNAGSALAGAFDLLDALWEPMRLGVELGERMVHADRIAPALRFIREHARRPIRRDDIAAACHMSATRLHALFTQSVGQTPMAFVNRERMAQARALLVSTDLPIKTIAGQVSPFDVFHFSRVFRSHFGISPRDYRRVHGPTRARGM